MRAHDPQQDSLRAQNVAAFKPSPSDRLIVLAFSAPILLIWVVASWWLR